MIRPVWIPRPGAWLLVAGFSIGAALAQTTTVVEPGWQKTASQRFETIDAGGRVRVDNPHGNIYGRFGGYENRVELLITVQHAEGAEPPLRVDVERAGTGLDVRAVTTDRPAPPARVPDSPQPRVDLVVFIPEGAILDARTEAGSMEIKGVRGRVVASSGTGDLLIKSVKGPVQAKTGRGRIAATLETGVTTERQDFTTITGDIEIHLWEDANVEARLSTSGEISTDFSLEVSHRRFEEPSKRATAVVGQGGPQLVLGSKRGRVKLLRLPRDFKPDRPGVDP